MYTNVHVCQRVIAVPNDLVDVWVRTVRDSLLRKRAEQSIARESELDELVSLMDGVSVYE